MEFDLLDFKIHEVDGMAHAKFSIKTSDGLIHHDEMVRMENEEDVAILLSIEEFVRKKVN